MPLVTAKILKLKTFSDIHVGDRVEMLLVNRDRELYGIVSEIIDSRFLDSRFLDNINPVFKQIPHLDLYIKIYDKKTGELYDERNYMVRGDKSHHLHKSKRFPLYISIGEIGETAKQNIRTFLELHVRR